MNRGEITIAMFLDFSRAFDTINYAIVIQKLYLMNFSKCFLYWLVDYLSNQQHYVQIDDKISKKLYANFGVSKGSILGLVFFNLHVSDMKKNIPQLGSCLQFADDSSLYRHLKPKYINTCFQDILNHIDKIVKCSADFNLVFNVNKNKIYAISNKSNDKISQPEGDHLVTIHNMQQ